MVKETVLLDWARELPWKQQSVLLSSLRGPDSHYCPNIKKITKWIRSVLQKDADPSRNYMRHEKLPSLKEFKKEIEFCSIHYAAHLLHTLEIIGYKHHNKKISTLAGDYYKYIASQILHLNPENREQLDKRLEDRV